MKINAGVNFIENGLTASLRAMHVQSELVGIINENVIGFDKVGYQRKEPIISSFTEFLGVHGLSMTVDDEIGRLSATSNPLDIALACKGYFQVASKEGVKLTRDGRFKVDKFGNLLTADDAKVLGSNGLAIKFSNPPERTKDVIVGSGGKINLFNKAKGKVEYAGTLGVVDANGAAIIEPNIKQGYTEFSNVALEREFLSMMPVLRGFDANRQIFMLQSQNLTKAISQLGSVS